MSPAKSVKVNNVVLSVGEFWFGGGHTRVHTLLGSCVAITLWHPRRLIGGMCHYLLPERGGNRRLAQGHYADDAVQLFMRAILRAKTQPRDYQVKLFGGAAMSAGSAQNVNESVARRNILHGMALLEEKGFTVKAADVGGFHHRRIIFELWSGDVWVRRGGAHPARGEQWQK